MENKDCECVNWCQDGRDMYADHHCNCQHYTPPPTDPRFARFGEAMWKYITGLGSEFCGAEISEDILPLAEIAGLCCRIEYKPAIHGTVIEAEPGDKIWWWGEAHHSRQHARDCIDEICGLLHLSPNAERWQPTRPRC